MAGKIKNCPACGKLFAAINGASACPDCQRKIYEKESEVINYVRDNPRSKVKDIIEATGAPEKMIKKMIREGRFEQVGIKMTYPCEKCGTPIVTGKICNSCMEKMRTELQKKSAEITAALQAKKVGRGRGIYSKIPK